MLLLLQGYGAAVVVAIAGAGGRAVFKARRGAIIQPRPVVTEDAARNKSETANANITHKAKKNKTGNYG